MTCCPHSICNQRQPSPEMCQISLKGAIWTQSQNKRLSAEDLSSFQTYDGSLLLWPHYCAFWLQGEKQRQTMTSAGKEVGVGLSASLSTKSYPPLCVKKNLQNHSLCSLQVKLHVTSVWVSQWSSINSHPSVSELPQRQRQSGGSLTGPGAPVTEVGPFSAYDSSRMRLFRLSCRADHRGSLAPNEQISLSSITGPDCVWQWLCVFD